MRNMACSIYAGCTIWNPSRSYCALAMTTLFVHMTCHRLLKGERYMQNKRFNLYTAALISSSLEMEQEK
ncbi:hypothetical protein L1987_15527 [Smallanthus sonchifolius]|uniref:Uncharacterized protein n=1 Tax=Smallanthus sonchifolius TaxID=185202 RepID=A0ACB9J5Q9_9ASTR|nr:hypothetical protein L1987_15527 [Smallanthus sonchifolius]